MNTATAQLLFQGLTLLPFSGLLFLAMLFRLRRMPTLKRLAIATGSGSVMALLLFLGTIVPPLFSSLISTLVTLILLIASYPLAIKILGAIWGINYEYPEQEFTKSARAASRVLESLKSPDSRGARGTAGRTQESERQSGPMFPVLLLIDIFGTLLIGLFAGQRLDSHFTTIPFDAVLVMGIAMGWFSGWLICRLTSTLLKRWKSSVIFWKHAITLALSLATSFAVGWFIGFGISPNTSNFTGAALLGLAISGMIGGGVIACHGMIESRKYEATKSLDGK